MIARSIARRTTRPIARRITSLVGGGSVSGQITANANPAIEGTSLVLTFTDFAIEGVYAADDTTPNSGGSLTMTWTQDTYSYQWSKDGTDLTNGGDISGATSTELTVANLETADAGTYSIAVTNDRTSEVREFSIAISTEEGLLLDAYSGAAAAYSLRKLRTAYSGSAIRVRRSSDNTEQDIGFTSGGDLDESALTTFCGSGDGFVATWYDQSGSGNNSTQSTAASQPKIVDSGSVIQENAKPAIEFSSSLMLSPRLLSDNIWAIFAVMRSTASGFQTFTGQHPGGSPANRCNMMQSGNTDFQVFFNNGSSRFNAHSTALTNTQLLLGSFASSDDYSLAINGDLELMITAQDFTPLDVDFNIGALGDGSNPLNGAINELIVWPTDQASNRIAVESDLNTYYSIY